MAALELTKLVKIILLPTFNFLFPGQGSAHEAEILLYLQNIQTTKVSMCMYLAFYCIYG